MGHYSDNCSEKEGENNGPSVVEQENSGGARTNTQRGTEGTVATRRNANNMMNNMTGTNAT